MDIKEIIENATPPLTIAVSSCLLGENCNYMGGNNLSELVKKLKNHPDRVNIVPFCPEESVLGTPREPMNIHSGDGFGVLSGEAKVLTHSGGDVTAVMVEGAQNLMEIIKEHQIPIAILKEGSPSCGSTRIYRGEVWPQKEVIDGVGVTTALLRKHGVCVISEAREKELQQLMEFASATGENLFK